MDRESWLDDCRTWCQQIKYLSDEIDWVERPNRSGWLEATSALLDAQRVTIPYLMFKGEYQPGRFGERITYGLMYREQREMRKVFMLEVYPPHERSHRENGVQLFGPHIHLGDERLQQVTKDVTSHLVEAGLQRWVDRFRRHARIYDNGGRRLAPPFQDDLFGQGP